MTADKQWHVEKTIPISVIVLFVTNLLVAGAAFGMLQASVSNNSEDIAVNKADIRAIEKQASSAQAALASIQTDISGMRRDLNRLIEIMDQMQRAP